MKSNQRSFFTPRYILKRVPLQPKCTKEVNKRTPHWSSSIPKRYKRHAIHEHLCKSENILSNFNNKKMLKKMFFETYIGETWHLMEGAWGHTVGMWNWEGFKQKSEPQM